MSRATRVGLIGLIAAGVSGVPRYAASLLGALDGVAGDYDDLRFRLVTTRATAGTLRPASLDVRVVGGLLGSPRAGGRRVAAEQIAAATEHSDLLHFFDLTGPLFTPWRPFVTTIHDTSKPRAYKRLVQPWAARHAAAAVAVSAYARDQAVRSLGADERRITVIHSGPGLQLRESATDSHDDGTGYLLYVGDLTEHKNLPFLVDVFSAAGVPERLVLAGRPSTGYDGLQASIESSLARERISVLRDVDDARLDGLYRNAVATVLPSRREGFGFTPLEAMARDCPVLASDLPALREVLGDGAMLLPIGERDAWVQGLQRIAGDETLRAALRSRGRAVAGRYSWERTARSLCELLRSVAP
jgi:glycosyltransferase involved in cell wall biosynthesis